MFRAAPLNGLRLVASDVYPRGGEQVLHRVEHLLQKVQGVVIRRQGPIMNPPFQRWLRRSRPARNITVPQFGICRNGSSSVAWHVDLWHHFNVSGACEGDDISDLPCSVGLSASESFSSHLCKPWVPFNRETPTLVVCEMPMEPVHLEGRHRLQERLYMLCCEKVPAHVKMETAPLKAWSILYGQLRQLGHAALTNKLPQGLDSVEESC
mmetsp:Transcript_116389/g.290654  ORF Transcript_116389/g.290654 Transcript_116389/m.290654 type:complete len:209 (-) Transcript_116389:737-1363(-)